DVNVLIALVILISPNLSNTRTRLQLLKPLLVILVGIIAFVVNLGIAEADRPQLLKRTFDRNYVVKYLGAYNFAVYDAIQNVKTSTQRVLADSSDMTVVENYTK